MGYYTSLDMIREFGVQVERCASAQVRERVMAGADQLTARSKPEQTALWMKEAVARLDGAVDEPTRRCIMAACGANCSQVNQRVIDRARARRLKYPTEEGFLSAEERKPSAGTRLEREGAVLYQTYTPQAFSHRCAASAA